MLLPAISHDRSDEPSRAREFEFKGVYERRLGKRSMIEFGVPIQNDGVDEFEIAFKHALYSGSPEPGRADRFARFGDSDLKDYGVFEPFVAAGVMLREWYIQAQLKAELPTDSARADRVLSTTRTSAGTRAPHQPRGRLASSSMVRIGSWH